jgi:hypothetical protein
MADPPVVAYVLATCPQVDRHVAVLRTFCDFPFGKSLVDAGVPRSRVCDMIIT